MAQASTCTLTKPGTTVCQAGRSSHCRVHANVLPGRRALAELCGRLGYFRRLSLSTGWLDGAKLVPRCRVPGRYWPHFCPSRLDRDACQLTAFRATTFDEEAPVDEIKAPTVTLVPV